MLILITYPLVLLSELITKVFTPRGNQASMSREEVSAMVDVGTTEGIFRESESKLIKSCIALSGVKARQIMTPSIVVESACQDLTVKDFQAKQSWSFSRIPVYAGDKDYITGYVLKDAVLKLLSEDQFHVKLSDLKRPILTFREEESVFQIWEKMLEKREHISVIIDEYGGLRGLVTMEDIIETMTGVEIVDEDDVAVDHAGAGQGEVAPDDPGREIAPSGKPITHDLAAEMYRSSRASISLGRSRGSCLGWAAYRFYEVADHLLAVDK